MDTAITVAVIAALVSLLSACLNVWVVLQKDKLEQQRQDAIKKQQAKDLLSRFRDPLLHSAFDLQSRLYNIFLQGFLTKSFKSFRPYEKEYAIKNTLYVIAEYLGWVEIIRREVQFLDLGDIEENIQLIGLQNNVTKSFQTARHRVFRIWRGHQRAIGEIMITSSTLENNPKNLQCIGYATFSLKLEDPNFSRWFEPLREDINLLVEEPEKHNERLVRLQHNLLAILDLLDPHYIRFPKEYRMPI